MKTFPCMLQPTLDLFASHSTSHVIHCELRTWITGHFGCETRSNTTNLSLSLAIYSLLSHYFKPWTTNNQFHTFILSESWKNLPFSSIQTHSIPLSLTFSHLNSLSSWGNLQVVALTNSQHRNTLMRRKKSFNIVCVCLSWELE